MAQSCKIGLLRHQQRIQNPRRKNPKRVKNKELRRNTRGLEYSRSCAQKSYLKTVQKLSPKIIHSKKSNYELLRCGKCDETFKKKFYFDFHSNISQVTSDFEKCKLCHFKSCTIIGLKMHVRKVHAQIHAINSKPSMDKKNESKSAPETRAKSLLKAAPKVEPKLVTIPEPKLVTKPEPKLVTKPKDEPKSEQKAVPKSMSKCASKSGQKPLSISESKLVPNHEQSKKSPGKPDQILENENKNKARFALPRPKKGQWIVRVEKLRITRM